MTTDDPGQEDAVFREKIAGVLDATERRRTRAHKLHGFLSAAALARCSLSCALFPPRALHRGSPIAAHCTCSCPRKRFAEASNHVDHDARHILVDGKARPSTTAASTIFMHEIGAPRHADSHMENGTRSGGPLCVS